MNYIKLIRWQNLLILALSQVLIFYSVIVPTLRAYSIDNIASSYVMWGMLIATCLIAAGGYVINDYFDIKIDRINKPERMIITNGIEKPMAMKFYQALTGLGIIIGLGVSYMVGSFTLAFIFVVAPGMLWFYSASYKRQLIIGNMIVAIAAALAVLLPLIAQNNILEREYGDLLKQTQILVQLYSIVCGFALFAFLFTFIREIIKDMEDEAGDREMECATLPIVCGTMLSKWIVTGITAISVGLVLWCGYIQLGFGMEPNISLNYLVFAVAVPSTFMLVILWGKSCKAYRNAGNVVKFIFITGLLYSVLFQFIMSTKFSIPFMGLFNVI